MMLELPLQSFGMETLSFARQLSEILTVLLGLAISYIAYRGYRRNQSRAMLFVAAGFVLYGPITTLLVADADGATEYVVEDGDPRDVGAVTLPDDPTVYGFGGRVPDWTDDFEAVVREIEQELKLRYGGAMIADVNQVLTYGGIFGYPGLRDRPEGKLRLLFEGAPIAYVLAAAGGSATDGEQSLLDVECTELHQRTPVFVGSDEYVSRVEDAL